MAAGQRNRPASEDVRSNARERALHLLYEAEVKGVPTGWTLVRMASIDRNILRIGVFELLGRPDVPTAVAINEAVNLAKTFSTD